MYGDLGHVDLVGPRGAVGQFVDLPDDREVAGLFQQALAHLWGFNGVEALRSFARAAALAPDCALCHWGVAMAYAPNINYYVENQAALNEAARRAASLAEQQPGLTRKSRRLIEAAAALVQDPAQPDGPASPARAAFARVLCRPFAPPDADVAASCAGALMATSPWNYYEGNESGGHFALKAFLEAARERLQASVDRGQGGRPHAFAIHLLIHLLEPSDAPEEYRWAALPATEELYRAPGNASSELVPAQGHLTHMPAHLFLRVGRYAAGVRTSLRSVATNRRYLAACLSPYAFGHNLKMLVANARFAGMSATALAAAQSAAEPSAGRERTPGGGTACVDCAGVGSPEVMLTLARFGRWGAVLAEARPGSWGDPRFAAYNEAAYHYARALALYAQAGAAGGAAAVGRADREAELAAAAASRDRTYALVVPQELRALRAWHVERNYSAAVAALEAAVAAVDALPYLEPPRWYYPPRQCLAAALLAAPGGSASRAAAVFEADLLQFPANAWSLHGAAAAMAALGNHSAAAGYQARAAEAWAGADVPLTTSCHQLLPDLNYRLHIPVASAVQA